MKLCIVLMSVALLTTGCTVGPRYKRPTVAVPGSYRGEAPGLDHPQLQNTAPQIVPFGDDKWWDIFQDEQLRTLIRTALQQNYDLRIAASRVLEAQATLIEALKVARHREIRFHLQGHGSVLQLFESAGLLALFDKSSGGNGAS